tara:strand:+ start:5749 stop:5979 length:231 start_codon:yes stop_codon:yes gene_type:complete
MKTIMERCRAALAEYLAEGNEALWTCPLKHYEPFNLQQLAWDLFADAIMADDLDRRNANRALAEDFELERRYAWST